METPFSDGQTRAGWSNTFSSSMLMITIVPSHTSRRPTPVSRARSNTPAQSIWREYAPGRPSRQTRGVPRQVLSVQHVSGNPVKYQDPTGHCAQDDYACWTLADNLYAWFDWTINGIWSFDEVNRILSAAYLIENWYQSNTEGSARAHVRAYFGGTSFHRSESNLSIPHILGRHHVEGKDVYLRSAFSAFSIVHELGHVLDNVVADRTVGYGAAVWGGGPADEMVSAVGQRWHCPLRFLCFGYGSTGGGESPPTDYARTGPSEDFAVTFMKSVINPGELESIAPRRSGWMRNFAALLVNETPQYYGSPYTQNQRHSRPQSLPLLPVPAPSPY
jgi:hypothetical protein